MTRNLISLLFLCLLASCQKNSPEISTTDGLVNLSGQKVEAVVAGQVLDQDDDPVPGVQVHIGEFTTYTNSEGLYLFPALELPEQGANLRLDAAGFFPYTTWVYPSEQSQEFVEIKLQALQIVDQFSSEVGGLIELGDVSVDLPPDGFVREDGTAYTGEVSVAAIWLDGAAPDSRQRIPGSVLGLTTEAELVALLQTGVLGVELYGASGESLQLAEGQTAEISLPVPELYSGGVESERSLWYLDETTGLWQEDGKARWENGRYQASVQHFTFWCCSPSYPAVFLSGKLETPLAEPVPFRTVSMEVLPTGTIEGGVRTRADGTFSGFAPVEEELRMIIWDPCGDVAFNQDIGSFTQNTNIGTFTVENDQYYQYFGQALDCSGEPIENAFITANWNGQNRTILSGPDGNFHGGMYLCTGSASAPFEIRIADVNAGLVTDWLIQDLGFSMDVGPQLVCELPAEDFIEVNCVGETRLFLTPNVGGYNGGELMAVWDSIYLPDQVPMHVDISVDEPTFSSPNSTMEITSFRYDFTDDDGTFWTLMCGNWGSEPCEGLTLEILENAGPGSYLHGTWSGTVSALSRVGEDWQPPTQQEVSGRFRVLQQ